MAGELPVNGQQTVLRVLVGANPPFGRDRVLSWKIKEKVTKFNDDHAGELNSKTDKQRDGWMIDLEFDVASLSLVEALESQYTLREANQPFEDVAIQLQLNQRNGEVRAYIFTGVTTEEELSMGGRKDRVKYSLSCDAERRILVR